MTLQDVRESFAAILPKEMIGGMVRENIYIIRESYIHIYKVVGKSCYEFIGEQIMKDIECLLCFFPKLS